jgi:hypothetical protein
MATENNPRQAHRGIVVIDVSDPRKPRATAYLADTPSALSPHENNKVNEKRGLLGSALAKQIERRHAKVSRYQGAAIDFPQLGILREPVHQHKRWGISGSVEFVANPVGSVAKEGHRAIRQEIPWSYRGSRGEKSVELYQKVGRHTR